MRNPDYSDCQHHLFDRIRGYKENVETSDAIIEILHHLTFKNTGISTYIKTID